MSERFADTQARFTAALRDPEAATPPDELDATRFAVYQDLVYRNLAGLLAGAFPVLERTLAAERWQQLLREFLARHRCRTPFFPELGAEFLSFLELRPQQGWEPPWLGELAHWERVELELAIATDPAPASPPPTALATAVLTLSPLARVLAYDYPVHRIGPGHDVVPEPTFLLAYRDAEDAVQYMALTAATARLLGELAANREADTHQLLAALAHSLGAPAEAIRHHGLQQLREFLDRGLLCVPAGLANGD